MLLYECDPPRPIVKTKLIHLPILTILTRNFEKFITPLKYTFQSPMVEKIIDKFDKNSGGVEKKTMVVNLHLSKNHGEAIS